MAYRAWWVSGACLAGALLGPSSAEAQDSVTMVPGEQYGAGALHRFVFGTGYRDLWTTPIRVPVLDLGRHEGGLTPIKKGGGQQTVSLRFRAADGREYSFRSVDKDPSSVLPEDLQGSVAEKIIRDQTSSAHPVGALVVAELLEAVGVLHAKPLLAVMPDDPRLGEFRAEFAGMLGLLELRPNEEENPEASFAGAIDVVGSEKFLEEIGKNPFVRPDARAFLRARLMDLFLGDWDRHRDQWRWALTDSGGPRRWVPIPRDRDQAFAKFDGFLLLFGRQSFPQFVNFGPGYANITGQTWNGRDLDRWILPNLTWDVWQEEAADLQRLLTDAALERAVNVLPPPYLSLRRDRMLRVLRQRRDDLVTEARTYYRMLAREVDLQASDRKDSAVVTRMGDGGTRVQLWADAAPVPYFDRTLLNEETRDLRIWLRGDDDLGVVRGSGGGPTVRFLGGGGDDRFRNEASDGRVRVYDDQGTNTAVGASINDKPYVTEADSVPGVLPPRDWGSDLDVYPLVGFAPDIGLLLSVKPTKTWYGFRNRPQASRLALTLSWATSRSTINGELEGDWWRENSGVRFGFRARGSGIEVLRWYGEGNNSVRGPTDEFNRVSMHILSLAPHLGVDFGARNTFEVGPMIKYSVTELDGDNADRFIAIDRPFGAEHIGQAGAFATVLLDGRDRAVAATEGVMFRAAGSVFPVIIAADGGTFGSVEGETAGYWSPLGPNAPTLALRLGGRRVWGDYPFFEAATLGGFTSRGFRPGRFAGDAAVWANGEVRLKVTDATLVVPGELGVFGFGDVGRVWLDGEDSDRWHPSAGGGVWFGILKRRMTVSMSLGRSREGTRFYAGSGFGF